MHYAALTANQCLLRQAALRRFAPHAPKGACALPFSSPRTSPTLGAAKLYSRPMRPMKRPAARVTIILFLPFGTRERCRALLMRMRLLRAAPMRVPHSLPLTERVVFSAWP